MYGKHGRHQNTGPEVRRDSQQDQQQRDCRGCMQHDIRQMVPCRIQAIELAVQQVRERAQRVPVKLPVAEGPGNCLKRHARHDLRVVNHILAVVEVDELVAQGLAEDQSDGQTKHTARGEYPAAALLRAVRTGGKFDLSRTVRGRIPGDSSGSRCLSP